MFNCIIEKINVLNNFKKVQAIAEKNPIIPISSNVLIETNKNTIVKSATNFEVGIIVKSKANIIEEGKIVVDAKKVYEIIKEMPDGEISIRSKDAGWVEINYNNKIIFNITGLSEEEFPSVKVDDDINFLKVNKKIFNDLIKKTIYATSNDVTRDVLRGILVERNDSILRMVATDGHRLALSEKSISKEEIEIEERIIIPKKGAREIKRLIEESIKEENIKFGFGKKNLLVKGEEETIIIRLIEGDFPDYKKVIPNNNKNKIIIKTDDLKESLNRLAFIIDEEIKAVKFIIKNGLLIIKSKRAGFWDAVEEREIDHIGDEIEIGLNIRYLLDVINIVNDKSVVLEFLDEKTPIIIKEKENQESLAVIMPMIL